MDNPKCPSCGFEAYKFLSTREPNLISNDIFRLFKCSICNLVFLFPQPSEKELQKFYYQNYYERPGLMMKLIQKLRVKNFNSLKPGRILDAGCGSGFFLEAMRRKGWECEGIEISDESKTYTENLKRKQIKVYNQTIEKIDFLNLYDLITFWHVFEHLTDPIGTLKTVWKILKHDGILMIAVPNIGSLQFLIGKKKWFHLEVPRHIFHFNPLSIEKMLDKNGFAIILIKHMSVEYNFFGYLQTLFNLIGTDFNFLYKLTKKIKPKGINDVKYFYTIFSTVFFFPIFIFLSFLMSFFEAALSEGGTMEVYARKKLGN